MRLFPKVDGTVDRFDRAGLLTCPFDLDWGEDEDSTDSLCIGEVYLVPKLGFAGKLTPKLKASASLTPKLSFRTDISCPGH